MKPNTMFSLPVSIGEALDKLTILDIKVDKIKDPQRNKHCKVEYDILYEQLTDVVAENKFYYEKLKDINESIWDMQDEVRASSTDIGQKCIDILNMNDSRFRIKDILNRKAMSLIQEQKSYLLKKVFILPHQGLGDHVNLIGAVRYFSLVYDEVHIGCYEGDDSHKHPRTTILNVKSFYSDNPKIKIISLPHAYWGVSYQSKLDSILTENYSKIIRLGFQSPDNNIVLEPFPDVWYTIMKLPLNYRKRYFHVPHTTESLTLFNRIHHSKYMFVHQESTTLKTNLLTWNHLDILTICPNENLYSQEHEWYELANLFTNKPFWMYYDTIMNASELHVINSSFFCIAMLLPCKAIRRVCYQRHEHAVDEYSTELFNRIE